MSATDVYTALLRRDCYVPKDLDTTYQEMIWKPIFESLPRSIVVDASNVCEYVHAGTSKGAFGVDDFPAVVPPFPVLWIETRAPSKSVTPDKTFSWDREGFGAQWGVLFLTEDLNHLDDDEREDTVNTIMSWRNGAPVADFASDRDRGPLRVDPKDVRWMIRAMCFVRYGGDTAPTGPMFEAWIFISPEGSICVDPSSGSPVVWMMAPGTVETSSSRAVHIDGMYHAWMTPILFTISLMNCKNVARVENYPKRHEIREAKRRKQQPPVKYYTLQIDPMRKVIESEGGIKANGLKKALHICRGHFSHYTEEKPLFGKYAGQFWIPAHVRGSADAGKVIKDYEVKAPAA